MYYTTILFFLTLTILSCRAADVWLVPMSGGCTSLKNSYIRYRDNICSPTDYWNTSAPFTMMTCNTATYPRRVTIKLYQDAGCTQLTTSETFDSENTMWMKCFSKTLGQTFSTSCFTPTDPPFESIGNITSFSGSSCQGYPTVMYGVSSMCAVGEKYMCERTMNSTILYRYSYVDSQCVGTLRSRTEIGVVGVCSGNNLTSSCPLSCFGLNPKESKVCSGRGTCISQDLCTCNAPQRHYGFGCEISRCNGLLSNESNVCSGNGKCVDTDTCFCDVKWRGDLCQFRNLTYLDDPKFYAALLVPTSVLGLCLFCTFILWVGCCVNAAIKKLKDPVDEIEISGQGRSWKSTFASCHLVNLIYNTFAIVGLCLAIIGVSLLIYQSTTTEIFTGSLMKLAEAVGVVFAIGLVVMCCCVPCYWTRIVTSSTGKYLMNIKNSSGLVDKIEHLRNTNPAIYLTGESWHWETRRKTVYKDHYINGRFSHTSSHVETETIRVSTGKYQEYFSYTQCVDTSNEVTENLVKHNLVKVHFTKSWFFGNQQTEAIWDSFVKNFEYKYHRDDHFDMITHFEIPGFEEKILSVTDPKRLPFWFSSLLFYFSSCFCCCLWPWSCWLDQASVRSSYQVVKTVFA